MNLWLIFLTGLTTGGLSCLAVQGGLLVGMLSQETQEKQSQKKKYLGLFAFFSAKLLIHVLFGFLLGAIGASFHISQTLLLTSQLFVGIYMFAAAMNILDVHPIFRHISLQPPKFLTTRIWALKKNTSVFAPFLFGLLTIFIPCGVTQAMEVNAVALGNPWQSALLLGTFVLGTFPLFGLLSLAFVRLSERFLALAMRLSAFLLLLFAVMSVNGVLEVVDSPVSLHKISAAWVDFWTPEPLKKSQANLPLIVQGKQQIRIDVNSTGYTPQYLRVKKGIPVELTLHSKDAYSCALAFTLSAFNIRTTLAPTDEKIVSFTPTKSGRFTYSCSMGMYTGVLEVIE